MRLGIDDRVIVLLTHIISSSAVGLSWSLPILLTCSVLARGSHHYPPSQL